MRLLLNLKAFKANFLFPKMQINTKNSDIFLRIFIGLDFLVTLKLQQMLKQSKTIKIVDQT